MPRRKFTDQSGMLRNNTHPRHQRRRLQLSPRQQRKQQRATRRGHVHGEPTRAQWKRIKAKEFLPNWERMFPGISLNGIMSLGVHLDRP